MLSILLFIGQWGESFVAMSLSSLLFFVGCFSIVSCALVTPLFRCYGLTQAVIGYLYTIVMSLNVALSAYGSFQLVAFPCQQTTGTVNLTGVTATSRLGADISTIIEDEFVYINHVHFYYLNKLLEYEGWQCGSAVLLDALNVKQG